MNFYRSKISLPLTLVLAVAATVALTACDSSSDSDTTGVGSTLARISIDGPSTITHGSTGVIDIKSQNIGFEGLSNSKSTIQFPTSLIVESVNAGAGASYVINLPPPGSSVGTTEVVISLGTLDGSSQTISHIRVLGSLMAGENSSRPEIVGILNGQEFGPGEEARASFSLTINR